MDNHDDSNALREDFAVTLEQARMNHEAGAFKASVQLSQQVIEGCAKAIISCFVPPEWTHDPGAQLQAVLDEHRNEIVGRLMPEQIAGLNVLAQDSSEAAPWHGASVYGKRDSGVFVPAYKLCTQEVADLLFQQAERAHTTATAFLDSWFGSV